MTTLSETLTLGLVLVLLFGSICLYLYTRIQQNEQKLNLVESILIDLKMTNEMKNYPDLPAPTSVAPGPRVEEVSAFTSDKFESEQQAPTVVESEKLATGSPAPVEESYKDAIKEAVETVNIDIIEDAHQGDTGSVKIGANYQSMTMNELKALAKQRGVVSSGMRRQQLIEALQTSDRAEESGAPAPMESFLDMGSSSNSLGINA
jgi:hypothetical protein